MGWTKRQLIDEAFGELALQGYEFDISPEEQQTALRRLDTMMAAWEARGVRVGYTFPSSPGVSDPDQDSGLSDSAVEPVYLNLAIRIATGFGKQLGINTRKCARDGYDTLLWAAAQPIQQQMPGSIPSGSGNKSGRPFLRPPNDNPLQTGQGGNLEFLGD